MILIKQGTSAYSYFTNPTTGEIQNEMDFHEIVLDAFQSIGMTKYTEQCTNFTPVSSVNEYVCYVVLSSNIVYI